MAVFIIAVTKDISESLLNLYCIEAILL